MLFLPLMKPHIFAAHSLKLPVHTLSPDLEEGMSLLAGKNILVTGVTKGIESEIVKAVYEEGANIIGHYGRDEKNAAQMFERYNCGGKRCSTSTD